MSEISPDQSFIKQAEGMGRVRTPRRKRSGKPVVTGERPAAYEHVREALASFYPDALSMDELMKVTQQQWKQSEILMATNFGIQSGELLRDATYYPARYKVNQDVATTLASSQAAPMNPPLSTIEEPSMAEPKQATPPVKVIHKKKRTMELPAAAKAAEAPARKKRTSGVFRELVTYLIRTGEQLTVEELLTRTGVKTTRQVLSSMLSDRFAKKDIARQSETTPYRYYISDELKSLYTKKFNLDLTSKAQGKRQQEMEQQAEQTPAGTEATGHMTAATMGQAGAQGKAVDQVHTRVDADADFDASITLDGTLTLVIHGQATQLKPEWTKQLARLIRFTAE